MRFSTTAVVAFILYISTGVVAAPLPPSYGIQELVARGKKDGQTDNSQPLQQAAKVPIPNNPVSAALQLGAGLSQAAQTQATQAGLQAARNAAFNGRVAAGGGGSGSGAAPKKP